MFSRIQQNLSLLIRRLVSSNKATGSSEKNIEQIRKVLLSFQFGTAAAMLQDTAGASPEDFAIEKALEFNATFLRQSESATVFPPRVVGSWSGKPITGKRFMIKGKVEQNVDRVGIFLNDRLIKVVNTRPVADDERHRREFGFNLKMAVAASFPSSPALSVGSPEGYLRHQDGELQAHGLLKGGDGTIFRKLAGDWFINKKGALTLRLDRNLEWKERALQAYAELKDYFEQRFGYKPYFICGSLLGYCREKDFIAHDDDLDVSFLSKETSPEAIKEEVKAMVLQLLLDGIDVKLPRRPGFFKPRFNGIFIDVTPMWHDKGDLWMLNATHLRAGPEIILPVREGDFLGNRVFVPGDPEKVLELEYGPGWRVPDPGYRTVIDPDDDKYLARSFLSAHEMDELYAKLEDARKRQRRTGRLTRAGSADFGDRGGAAMRSEIQQD